MIFSEDSRTRGKLVAVRSNEGKFALPRQENWFGATVHLKLLEGHLLKYRVKQGSQVIQMLKYAIDRFV